MFCPNCGTQNSETASTCIKCGFNLKGAAAPKFKGTMLMTNQPPGGAGAPPPPGAPPGPPRPAAPPAAPVVAQGPQGLAGTVIGVPPAGLGASAGPPGAPPPPAAPMMGPPPGQPAFGGAAAAPGAPGGYSPAGPPQGGVNPLGGTMAIDQMPGFAPPPAPAPQAPPPGFPPPAGGPPGGGFGAPAPQAGPYGQPPQGDPNAFGAPPGGGFGQQPGGYGAPPQQQMGGYGAPQGFGGPQGGAPLAAPGQFGAAPMGMGGFGGGAGGPVGQTRNPVMVFVLSAICGFYGLFSVWTMLNELKAYTRDENFKPWMIFIPFLGIYFWLFKVPEQVTRAKQMAGSRNPQSAGLFMYWLFGLYFLAKDLNEVWNPQS